MRNCVIHRGFVTAQMRESSNSSNQRLLASNAHRDIELIIRDDHQVVLLDTGHPASVADFFELGEEVMLYGAFRDGCLEKARNALLAKGISAHYHPTGSIAISMFGYDNSSS